jgi:ATP-dependent HslUV protease ATP-binding subunit HslU
LFEAPELEEKKINIDDKFVRNILKDIVEDEDLRRYIL